MSAKKKLSAKEIESLLKILKERFDKNMARHKGLKWSDVEAKLKKSSQIGSLEQMEKTGGEPDVIGFDKKTNAFIFCDCSAETPKDRRSICYDRKAMNSRKEHKPKNSAMDMVEEMGIEMLSEEQYRHLQTLGKFDQKTSSWVLTPPEIRALDGAIFCDRRYEQVFTYHNGAESYYAVRGFRGILKI